MPDLYREKLRQVSFFNKIKLGYDIIILKRNYKNDRKKYGVVNALKNVYKQVDRYMTIYVKQEQPTITCAKGCSFCCSFEVFMSNDEAKLLYDHTKKNKIQIDIAKASYQAINKFKIPLPYRSCIFLDPETNNCKVYEVRPLSCRTLLASSDPKFCLNDKQGSPLYFIMPKMENIKTAVWNSSISGLLPSMILKQMEEEQHPYKNS